MRRILDVHYSYFRIKPTSLDLYPDDINISTASLTPNKCICVPSIFFNILHLAIENDAMDVLRICLKYGVNPNEPGTTHKKVLINSNTYNKTRKTIRYPIKCNYCKKKSSPTVQISKNTQSNATMPKSTARNKLTQMLTLSAQPAPPSQQPSTANNEKKIDLWPDLQSLNEINYSSYGYLVRLPPLFLSISRCNHAATDLLLTYDACSNVQDDLGNTPLHLAVAKRQPCHDCVYLLLKYHATSLVFNNRLQSPITIIKLLAKDNYINLNNSSSNSTKINTNQNSDQEQISANTTPTEIKTTETSVIVTNTSVAWNYSLSAIHSSLISELFKNLELVCVSTSLLTNPSQNPAPVASAQNSANPTDSKQNKTTRTNTISQHLIQNKNDSNSNLKDAKDSNSNQNKNSKFKKSLTLVQNSSKRLPLSHSLKNISKLKNFSSSNSLSTVIADSNKQAIALLADSNINNPSGNATAAANKEFFRRIFHHSSSSDASTLPPNAQQSVLNSKNDAPNPATVTSNIVSITTNKITPISTTTTTTLTTTTTTKMTTTASNSSSSSKTNKLKSKPSMANIISHANNKSSSQKSLLTTILSNSKSKSLINVTQPGTNTMPSNNSTINQTLDKQEKALVKKYARYSKASPKSGSAVVRMPTINQSAQLDDTISRQTSLSNAMINKLNTVSIYNSNLSNLSRSPSRKHMLIDELSRQASADLDNQPMSNNNNPAHSAASASNRLNDNLSIVSSKLSLFKKTVKKINFLTFII